MRRDNVNKEEAKRMCQDRPVTLELEHVQLTAGLLFLAFISARPGVVFESSCKVIAGSNAVLLYRDIGLRLLQPPEKISRLILKATNIPFPVPVWSALL